MSDSFEFTLDELLPHSEPMILIDKIIQCGEDEIVSEVKVTENNLFLDNNFNIPAWIGIEYMAQTVAAFIGYKTKKSSGSIKIGLLLGTRKYLAHKTHFKKDFEYRIKATHLFDDQGLGSFDCQILESKNKDIYCEAKINAYQPDDINAYLGTLEENKNGY